MSQADRYRWRRWLDGFSVGVWLLTALVMAFALTQLSVWAAAAGTVGSIVGTGAAAVSYYKF